MHLVFSIEDTARLPDLEQALRRDLQMGLMDAIDLAIFEGDTSATGTDADITGLQTAANVVEKTLTQANKVKGPNTLQAFVELIDGIHAIGPGDLRIVSSVGANTLWMTTIANSAAENQTVAQFLMASGINWTARGGIDDGSTANKFGGFIGRGRGCGRVGCRRTDPRSLHQRRQGRGRPDAQLPLEFRPSAPEQLCPLEVRHLGPCHGDRMVPARRA